MKRVVIDKEKPWVQNAFCDHSDCPSHFKNTAWDSIKATDSGWFLQKDGDCWCPKHIPEWVSEWRAKKRGDYLGS